MTMSPNRFTPHTDEITNSTVMADFVHGKIHDGEVWGSIIGTPIPGGATLSTVYHIPDGYALHILYGFYVSGNTIRIRAYDDPNITNYGTPFALPPNRNRAYRAAIPPHTPPAGFTFSHTPTLGGALPAPWMDYTMQPGSKHQVPRIEDEIIMAAHDLSARDFIVSFTCGGGGAAILNISLNIYFTRSI